MLAADPCQAPCRWAAVGLVTSDPCALALSIAASRLSIMPADNAKLALGRKANLGLVDSVEPSLLRRRLPYLPYAAYDPTAGASMQTGAVVPMRRMWLE